MLLTKNIALTLAWNATEKKKTHEDDMEMKQ